jgi:sensor histidine kinase YesM
MTSGDERYPIQVKSQGLRPIPFLASFLVVGMLFAVQQWLSARIWYPQAELKLLTVMAAWELQYLLWGVLCLFLWRWLGQTLQTAGWRYILLRIVPLSIVMSVAVEMALVACFPQFPATRVRMSYWKRLDFSLTMEFLENTAIFWATFAILRAMGHYRESRQRERAMSELAVELAEARMLALRMQINPHFLFNTMNAISSLMYSDVSAADRMIEQLSNMLRVSLERGSKQLIRLREEMDFVEMYLSLQDIRSSGLVRQEMRIDPKLYDALVPAMFLQPLVENAYVHGLSRLSDRGLIEITAESKGNKLNIAVRNRGVGLSSAVKGENCGAGIGLTNIKSRLRLHFGDQGHLAIREVAPDLVEVNVTLPLVLATANDFAGVGPIMQK